MPPRLGPGRPNLRTPTGWATEPINRRRALGILGGTILAAGSGAALMLEGCGSAATPAPGVWVSVDLDPASLVTGDPASVSFTLPAGASSSALQGGTAWLVRDQGDSLVAFDPRCTHLACGYRWSVDEARFDCLCHKAAFGLDGSVLFGPPPRPLDRLPVRMVGGAVEIQVPADFATPRPSV